MKYEHRVQLVKINGKSMFTVVSNTAEIFAKYYLFAVRFDEKTNTFVLRKVNERNENNITEALLKLLQNKDIVINIDKDFSFYRENDRGEMVPDVKPYDDYSLSEDDSIEDRLNKIHSFVVNNEGCHLYSAVAYCDVESYFYYYDGEISHILVDISTLDANIVRYYSLDDGKPTFMQGVFDYRLPKNGKTITFQAMNGNRQLTRDGNKLFNKAQ